MVRSHARSGLLQPFSPERILGAMIDLRTALPRLLVLALLVPGCTRPHEQPSACDGLADKSLGITRDDYGDCAGEIVAELDGLELHLERLVRQGRAESRPAAGAHAARLRHLMRQV